MTMLRFLSLVALAVWTGGLGVLGGLAAPVVFSSLEAHDPVGGRELAGLVFGAIFQHFQPAAWICGGLLLATLGGRAALGPRPHRTRVRVWLVIAMLAISLVTALYIVPRMDRIRRETAGSIAALPAEDAHRVMFNRLHAVSNGLMLLTLAGGLALFWFEARDQH
jgi:Domain of unknown function (DUF4149)